MSGRMDDLERKDMMIMRKNLLDFVIRLVFNEQKHFKLIQF
jgi:hypothetical protein